MKKRNATKEVRQGEAIEKGQMRHVKKQGKEYIVVKRNWKRCLCNCQNWLDKQNNSLLLFSLLLSFCLLLNFTTAFICLLVSGLDPRGRNTSKLKMSYKVE